MPAPGFSHLRSHLFAHSQLLQPGLPALHWSAQKRPRCSTPARCPPLNSICLSCRSSRQTSPPSGFALLANRSPHVLPGNEGIWRSMPLTALFLWTYAGTRAKQKACPWVALSTDRQLLPSILYDAISEYPAKMPAVVSQSTGACRLPAARSFLRPPALCRASLPTPE